MANLTFMNHTIFDHGASAQLGQVLMQHGIRRPLLCTDKGLVNLGLVTDLVANLGNDAALTIYDGTPENPTQVSVEEATAKYLEADCDGVVAFGGGSSMDLAKAVALAVTHTGELNRLHRRLGGRCKNSRCRTINCDSHHVRHRQRSVLWRRYHYEKRRETDTCQ